ncbi:heparanase-like protein 3 [Phtheirospermum japonicum]|uniref:Heparanase-like protein 3 n=1 Tax=Phtheirospermum japonicum TaxID=374723 RepID=A0A830CIC8_9LAMI|nr:heparanase-like protein 3 [Phtheirospermum japonicum]
MACLMNDAHSDHHTHTPVHEMASMLKILGLSLWLYLASQGSTTVVSQSPGVVVMNGTVTIDGGSIIARTDEDFVCATVDWWPPTKCDYGTCSWGSASLLNLDLRNKIFLNAIKAFSPLKIRLGGTLQDKVRYQTRDDPRPCTQFVKNSTETFGFTEGCLPLSRWDELNNFFKLAGAKIIFGLNALTGRTIGSDGNTRGAWNSSNSEYLIRHTVDNGYTIHGWELGNELSGKGIGASVAADQYASDMITLDKLVQDIYKEIETKPLVLGPGGFFDAAWFTNFVNLSSTSLQVVTHHIYNLGPGVDDRLVEKILDPTYLDGEAQTFRDLHNILKSTGNSTVAWVGEAGGAYNSGRNLVTNAFVFSFWYLDQLGMSSSYDTKTYCRQSLIGGNYGFLDTNTFVPNPDYYSALLWHRLMGRNVISTSFNGTNKIRAYAHCSRNSVGITLLLINLDNSTTVQVGLSIENAIPNKAVTLEQIVQQTENTRFGKQDEMARDEYRLTANKGDLHSRTMLLNGEIISINSSGIIPDLQPKRVDASEPITVAPLSILFTQIPFIQVPACK